ncbi:MAG: hypothetical protein V4805_06260 [Pseudomonadota bacterium]
MDSLKRMRFILAFDSVSGLTAGFLTWALIPVLQPLNQWTLEFARFIASANIGYGLFAGALFLLFRKGIRVSLGLLAALVVANSLWAVQCLVQVWRLQNEVSFFGLGHLVLEGAYVGLVAYFEARIFFPPKKSA